MALAMQSNNEHTENDYLFCPFCGLPVGGDTFDSDIIPRDDLLTHPYGPFCYDGSVITLEQTSWTGDFQVITRLPDIIPTQYDFLPDFPISVSPRAYWRLRNQVSFPLAMTGGSYTVFDDLSNHAPGHGIVFRVPAHSACLTILDRLLAWRRPYRNSSYPRVQGLPTDIQQIYDAIQQAKDEESDLLVNIEWPNLYLNARHYWNEPWLCELGKEWFAADPINITDPTPTIISWLQPLPQPAQSAPTQHNALAPQTGNLSPIEALPATVHDGIRDSLDIQSAESLRRCSSTMHNALKLTPRFWRTKLLRGEAVPWLWDLDIRQVEVFDVAHDWSGLIRELKRPDLYNDNRLPIGLRNRIRIFRIIEEIRLRRV
ncbi:hypothetical protein TWF718_010803 [Orbilia javanica]|uniref:F-box domain-containing protein n=1 Tax=Orbilia javanica TaxID=47235 RepID=A0AAN8MP11_9PEZI